MWGLISRLFEKIDVNDVTSKMDDWNFTEEERSKAGFEWLKLTMNEGYNLARRYIAISWIIVTLFMALCTFAAIAFGVSTAAAMKAFIVEMMLMPTQLILGFYYGPGIISKVRGMFGKKKE